MPQLICHVTRDYPQIFDLIDEKISVGRGNENRIPLLEASVSVRHAELIKKADGNYWVKDLGSSNGTQVNSDKVIGKVLKDGDRIKFGTVKAVFLQQDGDPDRLRTENLDTDFKSKAEEMAQLEKTIKIQPKQINSLQDRQLNKVSSELASAQHLLKKLQSELAEEKQSLNLIKKETAKQKAECEGFDSERKSQLKQKKNLDVELDKLAKELEVSQSELQKNREKASNREKKFNKLTKKIETKQKVYEGLDGKISELDKAIPELEKKHADLGKEITTQKQALISLEDKVIDRENAFEKLGKKIEQRSDILVELEESIASKQKQAAKLAARVTEDDAAIRGMGGKVAAMESSLALGLAKLVKAEEKEKSLRKESQTLSQLVSEKSTVLQQVKAKIIDQQQGSVKSVCRPLRVIQSGTPFLVHYFHHGPGQPGEERVNPVGLYGLAACTRGSVHREFDTIPQGTDPVLLLLTGDINQDRDLIGSVVNDMPTRVLLICWRGGQFNASEVKNNAEMLTNVSGIISVDTATSKLVDELQLDCPHLSIPLPCPIDFPEWQIKTQTTKRAPKIFVTADNFDTSSKLHQTRVELLNQLVDQTALSLTLYQKKSKTIPGLKIPKDRLTTQQADLSYNEYLALVSEHPFVTNLGTGCNGVNIGDATLAKNVFVGGDFESTVDEMLYPEFCIKDGDIGPVLNAVEESLANYSIYQDSVDNAQLLAPQIISFETVSSWINEFLESLSKND